MRKALRFWFIFANILFAAILAAASDGPETGGGGNTILLDGSYYLIDLFNASQPDQAVIKAIQNHPEISRFVADPSPTNVQKTAAEIFQKWGIDIGPFAFSRSESVPAGMAPVIKRPLSIQTSQSEIEAARFYSPYYLPVNAKVFQAAYYDGAGHSIKISESIWAQTGPVSKLGLIIHENMRHLQIGLGHRFNDEILQKATLIMLICRPQFRGYIVPLTIEEDIVYSKIIDLSGRIESCLAEKP